MADKKVYKDEKGHFTNKENDGGPCHHDGAGSGSESEKTSNNYKKVGNVGDGYAEVVDSNGRHKLVDSDTFDDDYDEEFGDNNFDKEPDDYEKIQKQIGNFNKLYDSIQYAGYDKLDELEDAVENAHASEEISEKDYEKLTEMLTEKRLTGEYDEIHKSAQEQDKAMAEHRKKEEPYKARYANEDFEDARFYPVTDEDRKNAGPKYMGRYHSIADAHGLTDDNDTWDNEHRMFKYAGNSETGASIVQGPDGYFSGNPRINSMSFKTFEQARDYLDGKNPDDHKYGTYYEGDVQKIYRGKDDNGKEYDLEAPDVYKAARTKKSDLTNKIKDQVDDGVTEDDIGYLRQVLNETGINQLTNDQIRKIISSIRSRK